MFAFGVNTRVVIGVNCNIHRTQTLEGDVRIAAQDERGHKYEIVQDEHGNVISQCRSGGMIVAFKDLPKEVQELLDAGVGAAPCT